MELDSDLLLLLMDLVFSLLIGGELGPAHLLRSNILSKMEQKWQRIGSPQSLRPLAARGVAARPGTLLDFRSQDLAEQLTLLDSELFYKIELPEVLLWSKEQNEEKSPNLTEFTQHFNNVSFW
ncbi:rap guanine nucleotide exchange factor 1-like [Seriola lalandi dorsalis]|nr:rap guanine nucleotide exchange factor 1-like [Seriola lalandi dorsalis]XP_023254283.1 rap guanine nucleotide exchange factor 1-like [Seriola lalandi dorsalis]XP_023254541.1 rap guanine nucleotide exchange factor 1-like [Seriola lalandi dorsalis]XP_023267035.1 rap guanine nucleotide exchange factor 1-like [Seriola lalandi dorsalis]